MFERLTDTELLTCLIHGEARGESVDGQIAVAYVVHNRVYSPITWWGETWREVILKPYQFSCFNDDDPNLSKINEWLDGIVFQLDETQEWWVAQGVQRGVLADTSKSATHYYGRYIPPPNWAKDMKVTARIGNHVFMRET